MENITALLISLSALLTAVVALVNNVYKSKEELKNTLPRKIKEQCNVDMQINEMLEEVKEVLKADRVQIYDFHNRRALRKWA